MKIRTIPHIGKNMLLFSEGKLPGPHHTFGPHMAHRIGFFWITQNRQGMATYTTQSTTALWQLCRTTVRAACAK